jgi:hypothetical protein
MKKGPSLIWQGMLNTNAVSFCQEGSMHQEHLRPVLKNNSVPELASLFAQDLNKCFNN